MKPCFMLSQPRADSLKALLAQSKNDTNRLVLTFSIGEYFWKARDIPAAGPFLHEAIRLSDQYHYYPYQVNALNLLANAKLRIEEYDSVFFYLKEALQKINQQNDKRFLPLVYETYHHLYYELGDYNTALHYAMQAAKGYEESKDPSINKQVIWAYISVGQVFRELNQTSKALEYFTLALTRGKQYYRTAYITDALLNIAILHQTADKLTEAQRIYDTVILLDREHYNQELSTFAYEGLGIIASKQKDYRRAMQYYQLALQNAKKSNQNFYFDNLLVQLGEAHFLSKQYQTAVDYYTQSMQIAKAAKDAKNLSIIYTHLANVKRAQQKFEQALYYQELAQQIKDSLITVDKIRFTNNLEILYRTQQKEAEIARLQASNSKKEFSLLQQNRLLWISGALLLTVVFFSVFFYHSTKNKSVIAKQFQQLQEEKIKALESESKLLSLQSLIKGQEMERTRIARDIHDSVGSLISIILFRFNTLRNRIPQLEQDELFKSTVALTDETLKEVRRITHNLAPEALLKLGLKEAILEFCDKVKLHSPLKFTVQIYGLEERLTLPIEANLFAIIQELIQNVIKHGEANKVIIQINRIENTLHLTVEDDGKGFDVDFSAKHTGLNTVRYRALSMNGVFTLESTLDVGTTATLEIPIPREAPFSVT